MKDNELLFDRKSLAFCSFWFAPSVSARNLFRAGKDVTLFARGNWVAKIKQNGLRIKDKFSPRTSVRRIPVVTELAPDDRYDAIFVVLRYTQLDSALETLRANQTKNIVFVGNNVRTGVLAASLPGKRKFRW